MSDCIEWPGGKTKDGYPVYWDTKTGRSAYAHRRAWERVHGPLPDDHQVHHVCFNRACINPDHLEAVHKCDHGVLHRRERCQRGHLMEGENVYLHPDGKRRCRTCIKESKARRREEQRRREQMAQDFFCLRSDVIE